MLQVKSIGKPVSAALRCNAYLETFLNEYTMPEDVKVKKDKSEKHNLGPTMNRMIELFVEKSASIPMYRNIWEEMDEELERKPFNLQDERWSCAPRSIKHSLYYLATAFAATKKWGGHKVAEHLKFQIKDELVQEVKKNEMKTAVKCLECEL